MIDRKKKPTSRKKAPKDELIEDVVERVEEPVNDEIGEDASFEDYENAVLRITNEIARRRLQRKLQNIADAFTDELRIDHNNDWHGWRETSAHDFRKHLPGTVRYHSLVGGLDVRRFTYRECHRNGASYVPLELEAGLMERMTPGLARAVAMGASQMPTREFEKVLLATQRCPPSCATLDRGARDLGAYALAANEEIEPKVRAAEVVPLEANGSCSASIEHGKRIVSRHYRLSSECDPAVIVERMMADVRHAKSQCPRLGVAVVQDGAPELWNVMRRALADESSVDAWHEALDWYHLAERLAECVKLCCSDDAQRRALRRQWHTDFHEHRDGAERVLRSLARRARVLRPEERDAIRMHMDYLAKRKGQTRYPTLRRRGLPIGSGVTEGACKSLVAVRAKRGGQHWTQRGLSATLHLRAIVQSDRFDSFWSHFSNRYRANPSSDHAG